MTTRVVQVFGAMDVGGAEMRALDFVRATVGRPVEFDFVTLSGRSGSLAEEFAALGATVTPMALGPLFPLTFVRHLRRQNVDVVHSHIALTSGLILLLARFAGVRVRLAHFHSDGDGQADSALRRLYRRLMSALVTSSATHILGVSPSALASGYRADWAGDPRASLVANGVDTTMFFPEARTAPGPELRVLSLGRSSPEKNLERMPQVLASYRRSYGGAELRIVGPRNELIDDAVRSAAGSLDVADSVYLVGPTTDVRSELQSADVLLLTSFREGLPSVVLEAAAMGVPVVSSDVGGSVWISEWFPWVRCLSLDEPDESWSRALRDVVSSVPSPEEVAGVIAHSPFTMEANVEAVLKAYARS